MTEGIQQGRLRTLVGQALAMMEKNPPADLLPAEVLDEFELPSLRDALAYLHKPPPEADLEVILGGKHPCQVRLSFEELLAHYMSLRNLRHLARKENAIALPGANDVLSRFVSKLPYELTAAQKRVIKEIGADICLPHPMMRLIQGDVGSGKTVVAATACLLAVSSGVQAAVMAPTELLAEQHWQNFSAWFDDFDVQLAWLSGSQRQSDRRASLEAIESGRAGLIIGTHALFQEGVQFKNLALVVIDEQHRFGVHQRMALRDKGATGNSIPHQLVMTATPFHAPSQWLPMQISIHQSSTSSRPVDRPYKLLHCRTSDGVKSLSVFARPAPKGSRLTGCAHSLKNPRSLITRLQKPVSKC